MNKVKVGIIGTGWIANAHIQQYIRLQNEGKVEITAVCDLDIEKAKKFIEKYDLDVPCYKGHLEMLNNCELDAVSICVYNCGHRECIIDSLAHGMNVLAEKPLCVTVDECFEIKEAVEKSDKLFTVGFQERYDANVMKIKEIVEQGLLGKIYYIQTGGGRSHNIPVRFGTTFIDKNTGGFGAVGDIGCYALDIVLDAIGYPKPLSFSGFKTDYFGKQASFYEEVGFPGEYANVFGVDDFAAGFIRLENDIALDFRISWAMNLDSPCDTIIMGTEGTLRIPASDSWSRGIGGPLKLYRNNLGLLEVTCYPYYQTEEHIFYTKISKFVNAILGSREKLVDIKDIIANQLIISGLVKSAELGREISLEDLISDKPNALDNIF